MDMGSFGECEGSLAVTIRFGYYSDKSFNIYVQLCAF